MTTKQPWDKPHYGGEEIIVECLNSLKNIDYPNMEIIVVDNNSSDKSCEMIKDEFPEVTIIKNKKNDELLDLDKKIYGPIVIQSKSYKDIKGRKILNVLNQENKKLILSINCDTDELDIRVPGRKWMGSKTAKEEFEKDLINDFCYNFN